MAALFTVPAHLPFLDAVAVELLRRPVETLADTLVLLPSRRACLSLRDAMMRAASGRALLLPRFQPVGELETDELLLDPQAELELLPALPPLRRHLLLTQLVLAKDHEIKHEQAIRLAGELMGFLDEVATENVPLERLDGLVTAELAEHWQQTLEFLRILTQVWPDVVAEQGRVDPVERRNRLLAAWIKRWQEHPPRTPVIAAGVTGSIPKVAELLGVIARLPQGCVVLPGLDGEALAADWDAVGASHPQYSLKRLLERIGIERLAVRPWPVGGLVGGTIERARFMAEVMRPATRSDAWQDLVEPPSPALAGLEIATATDLASEAVQLSLRIRAALEEPGKRVALVSSDRNLARRVAAELARWGVRADDSAGIPLDQSPPGSFLLLSAHCIVEDGQPIHLLSALKHPLASGGMAQGEFRRRVRALERAVLRGPRPAGGLAAWAADLRNREPGGRWPAPVPPQELADWLDKLLEASQRLRRLAEQGTAPLPELLEAHLSFANWLATDEIGKPDELWAREAGATALRFITCLREAADLLQETPTSAYPALLAVLMGRETVRPLAPAHPRVAILGQLESRLQQADLVLIGGLNEGVWPRHPESGPWLSRSMRKAFGLPPAELQVGIAAHDLYLAACAPEVVFSRSRKDETGAPTIPSRWLARLEAVVKATDVAKYVTPSPTWAAWAMALDTPPGPPRPCSRPTPRPPLAARPRDLSATEIESLIRDPYRVYAQRILKLTKLEPLDDEPGLPERGQIIHDVIEAFLRTEPDGTEPLELLLALGRQHFARYASAPQVRALWWPRFEGAARWFVVQHRSRQAEIAALAAELRGSFELDTPGGPIRIRARADRVEVRRDGSLAILDYKTGTLPTAPEVRSGIRPQLLIEAMIAAEGGFPNVPAAVPTELLYWGLKGAEEAPGEEKAPCGEEIEALLATARLGLTRLLAHFADPGTAYIAVPHPEIAPTFNDYDHLARIAEWRDAGTAP
jgi:ATP-dependent helicase/nuclease subunit B